MLLLVGAFKLIGGFVALFEDDQYLVGERDLLVTVSYTWFGIAHMALGVLMIIASYGLFWGRTWGASWRSWWPVSARSPTSPPCRRTPPGSR